MIDNKSIMESLTIIMSVEASYYVFELLVTPQYQEAQTHA